MNYKKLRSNILVFIFFPIIAFSDVKLESKNFYFPSGPDAKNQKNTDQQNSKNHFYETSLSKKPDLNLDLKLLCENSNGDVKIEMIDGNSKYDIKTNDTEEKIISENCFTVTCDKKTNGRTSRYWSKKRCISNIQKTSTVENIENPAEYILENQSNPDRIVRYECKKNESIPACIKRMEIFSAATPYSLNFSGIIDEEGREIKIVKEIKNNARLGENQKLLCMKKEEPSLWNFFSNKWIEIDCNSEEFSNSSRNNDKNENIFTPIDELPKKNGANANP